MNCLDLGVSIPNDTNGKLSRAVEMVADGNAKMRVLLAGYIVSDEFLAYVQQDSVAGKDFKSLSGINVSTLRRLLRSFYFNKHPNVNSDYSNKFSEYIGGFSNSVAMYVARNHTADIINNILVSNMGTDINYKNIIANTIKEIEDNYIKSYVQSFLNRHSVNLINEEIDKLNNSKENKSKKEIEDINNKIKELKKQLKVSNKEDIKKSIDRIKEVQNKRKELFLDLKIAKTAEEKSNISKAIKDVNNERYIIISNLLYKYGNTRERNYTELVRQIRGATDSWFDYVFTSKKLLEFTNKYKNEINDSNLEDLDNDDDFENSINQLSKTQFNSTIGNFENLTDGDVNTYLSSLYILNSPIKDNSEIDYNTDNELGVATTMSITFIKTQISNFGDFTSVDNLIKSLERASNNIPKLYGLSKLVNDMKSDRVFANKIFYNFNNPKMNKSMIVKGDSVEFDASNKSVNPKAHMIFTMLNTITFNHSKVYNSNDRDRLDSMILRLNKIKNKSSFSQMNLKNEIKYYIFDIIDKYFNIDEFIVDQYLKDGNEFDNYSNILNDISTILTMTDNVIDDKNKELLKNKEDRDFSSINYRRYVKPIISLVDKFSKYIAVSNELNTYNAEGNLSSDLVHANFITNTLAQFNYSSEENEYQGLLDYKSFIEQSNQYSQSPLLYGVRDSSGKELIKGIFTKKSNGEYVPHVLSKDIVNVTLFDGIRNSDNIGDSSTYSNMPPSDYFFSGFLAFKKPIKFNNLLSYSDKFVNDTFANYFMRTLSDAPKNYIVQGLRYSTHNIYNKGSYNRENVAFRALYQNLLGEISHLINQLNNIFEYENGEYKEKTNIDDLSVNYHYKKTLFKDGRLTGNIFRLNKLFKLDYIDVNKEFEDSVLLYGEGKEDNSLIYKNENGYTINTDHPLIKIVNGKIELNHDNNLDNLINDLVEKWINGISIYANSKFNQYSNILDAYEYEPQDVFDYIINTSLAYMDFDILFEGDSAIYKDAQTQLKRAKEISASGYQYGGFDFSQGIDNGLREITDSNKQSFKITIKNKEIIRPRINRGVISEQPITLRNGFRAVTIKGTEKPSTNASNIENELFDILKDKVDENNARKFSSSIADRYYGNTAINDAQSYITLEMFIERVYADGSIGKYEDLIDKLLDPNVSIDEINSTEFNEFIQVQKNFYFDRVYDNKTNTFKSRQIKNSEFVLIPKFIKGTDLEKLYDLMIKYDIGQVNTSETSKASNVKHLDFWDSEGVARPDVFEQQLIERSDNVETYYNKFLYRQQKVPQHFIDSFNKAGIQIMKKTSDNYNDEVFNMVQHFMSLYTANIEESFDELLNEMGWSITNGFITNKDGSKLSFVEFYKLAKKEAIRTGADSNLLEYFDTDIFGNPIMPNFNSNVYVKMEQIAQSIFNNRITRQKLPGWHGAQVSSLGFNDTITDDNNKKHKLRYHPFTYKDKFGNIITLEKIEKLSNEELNDKINNGDIEKHQEHYAEILIPKWSKVLKGVKDINDIDESILKQLGYRIPTEGKQSISIFKVVGFLPDSYGSTIVVPDEWVTQTGSDFDVDSIYSIVYNIYIDKKGAVQKYKFETKDFNDDPLNDYIKYLSKITNSDLTKSFDINSDRDKLIKDLNRLAKANKTYEYEDYISIPVKKRYINHINSKLKKRIIKNVKESFNDYYYRIEQAAEDNGLVSFDEFKNWNIYKQNSRKARENEILDTMIKIMEHSNSREENYSGSNFDDLLSAMDRLNELSGNTAISRSGYNFFDQIDYMENAMGGATLKAFSVARDNFCSICNVTKAKIHDDYKIPVFYKVSDYNIDNAIQAYDDIEFYDEKLNKIDDKDKAFYFKIYHKNIANSKNNRNVVGKLITAYSSQTTAHILDAIKTGAITNENKFTFGTFKTLVDIGIDYDTAIAFLMQPAITELVKAYNESNSIYISDNTNPFIRAFKTLISKYKNIPYDDINLSFSNLEAQLDELFDLDSKKLNIGFNINKSTNGIYFIDLYREKLENRLSQNKSKVITKEYKSSVTKIISGGQTGVDTIGLEVAKDNNIETGGTAPRGFWQEESSNAELSTKYGLNEITITDQNKYNTKSGKKDRYSARTELNVFNSDATVYFSYNGDKAGYIATKRFAEEHNKPFITNPTSEELKEFITKYNVKTLNVAGNRGSALSSKNEFDVRNILTKALTEDKIEINDNSNTLYDIAVLSTFYKIYKTAEIISKFATSVATDKNSARVSVDSTRDLYKQIEDLYTGVDADNYVISDKNGIPLIKSIYPDLEHGIDLDKSSYKYLAAFVKYSTVSSIRINSQLLALEDGDLHRIIDTVKSTIGRLDEKSIKSLKEFIVSSMYDRIDVLNEPLVLNKYGMINFDGERSKEYYESNKEYWNTEKLRVQGLYNEINDLIIDDVNKPTKEEIDKFNRLSPVDKLQFIKFNFKDKGVFEYYDVNVYNKNKSQVFKIKFNEGSNDIENVYVEFMKAFYSKNPLIRMTAIDFIKYAHLVERFKFKNGNITKTIPNKVLYSDITDNGTGITSQLFDIANNPNKYSINADFIIDRFIRSHSNLIKPIYIGYKNKFYKMLTPNIDSDGIIMIQSENNKELINKLRIKEKQGYVHIERKTSKGLSVSTLYKYINKKNIIYLYPVNKLESEENTEFSLNNDNKYKPSSYYESIIENHHNGITISDSVIKAKEELGENINTKPNVKIKSKNISFDSVLVSGTDFNKSNVKHFIEKINSYISTPLDERPKSLIIRNDSSIIKEIVGSNGTIQTIRINDSNYKVLIKKYKKTKRLSEAIKNQTTDNTLSPEETTILKDALEHKLIYPNLYKVMFVKDNITQNKTEVSEESNEEIIEEFDIRYSIGKSITDVDTGFVDNPFNESDKLAKMIYKNINYASLKGDERAELFTKKLKGIGLDINDDKSIIDNKVSIFISAHNYFMQEGKRIKDSLSDFHGYSINDDELYKFLLDNPEYYNEFVELVLQAKTFGEYFDEIFQIDPSSEDPIIEKAINGIKDIVLEVRNNPNLITATNNIFNKYMAEMSSNPIIANGISELTTIFGDTGWIDTHISDISEIPDKQIQAVVKYIYTKLEESKLEAEEYVKEFSKRFDELSNKSDVNMDNVIDEKGKYVESFDSSYIDDYNSLQREVKEMRSFYGEDSVEYHRAKLNFDKFNLDNVEQVYERDYYLKEITAREKAFNNNPKLFVEYNKLLKEYYSDKRSISDLTKEEREERVRLKNKLTNLISIFNDNLTRKTKEEIKDITILVEYLKIRKDLNNKYFDYAPSELFKKDLEYHKSIIDEYNKKHPYETLEQKLNDKDFKNSYNWLNNNTFERLDPETGAIITKAFETLKSSHKLKLGIEEVLAKKDNAYDINGNIDPSKFSEHSLKRLKDIQLDKELENLESDFPDKVLIKDIPRNIPFFSKETSEIIKKASGKSTEDKKSIIRSINRTIRDFVTPNYGIDSVKMLKTLDYDKLYFLSLSYKDLRKNSNKDADIDTLEEYLDFKVNQEAFDREYLKARLQIKDADKMELWFDIFCEKDKKGNFVYDEDGNYLPNKHIFGYAVPKNENDIDLEKEEAKQIIENNIEFIPIERYYEEYRKATENGTFKEWFDNNHVFNPYTLTYEPLRVWTKLSLKEGNTLNGEIIHYPSKDFTERKISNKKYLNPKYIKGVIIYNKDYGHYNTPNKQTDNEKAMSDLLKATFDIYKGNYKNIKFVSEGYAPRRGKHEINGRFVLKNIAGLFGLENNSRFNNYSEVFDYISDKEVSNDMLQLLRGVGFQELLPYPKKGLLTDEEYAEKVKIVNEKNDAIRKSNLDIDNSILDRDWKNVFIQFIRSSYRQKSKDEAKNTIYLLLKDLKDRDVYKTNTITGDLKIDKVKSTKTVDEYQTIKRTNAYKLVENWGKRVIYDQHHKGGLRRNAANILQNITSAKFMTMNIPGGFANIGIGLVNIAGEAFAGTYFDKTDLIKAQAQYTSNILGFISSMYNDKSPNKTIALTKFFDIVDFDDFTENRPDETVANSFKRARNLSFAPNASGEHYMHNVMLLSLLKSNKVYNVNGEIKVGDYNEFVRDIELQTLYEVVKNNFDLEFKYNIFIKNIKYNHKELQKYDNFKRNIVSEFLKDVNNKELIDKYIKLRDEKLKNSKKEFAKYKTLEDSLEFADGTININPNSEISPKMIAEFKLKVISINKKTHGIYDKLGAAYIEREWFGSVLMQFHKHIYPGIMKRFRTKGYYNEQRKSIEKGSYISLFNFITTEFNKVDYKSIDNVNSAIDAVKSVMKGITDTVVNLRVNWSLLPQYEKQNIKRVLGDLSGVLSAFLIALAIHLSNDEEEIKDDILLSNMLYLADRLNSESIGLTPIGIYSEFSTLWSSPIAAKSSIHDLYKAMDITLNLMFDENYNINYEKGIYKGKNRYGVLLRRNTPVLRVYDRIVNMPKNNSYYRIDKSAISTQIAKNVADEIKSDK